MTLPFQKLPLLVIQVILQTMGFLDLFFLSCTSTKTKRIIKKVFTVRKHSLVVDFQDAALILTIQSVTNPTYGEAVYFNFKDEQENEGFHVNIGAVDRVPSEYFEAEGNNDALVLSTYWEDPLVGFNVLSDALFQVFQATVKEVMIDLDEVPVESYQNVIDWTDNMFPTLPAFRIIGCCSFQNYTWLMKNVKVKNAVLFLMEPRKYPENHEIVNLEMEEINIRYGKWMKMQDIQAIKARNIGIEDVSLTDNEINILLKNLEAFKEKSNLKKLVLNFYREADPEIVLGGLDVVNEDQMKPAGTLNQWSFKLENGQKCTVLYSEYVAIGQFGFEMLFED